MYDVFYGLRARPFQLNPDPGFFFGSDGHERALAYLRFGLQQGQGFVVVTGDIGTGKTMLLSTLFQELDPQAMVAARIASSNLPPDDLLRTLCDAFGGDADSPTKAGLLRSLTRCFETLADSGRRALVVVDEVQNLPLDSLEELRMLSNLEHAGHPVLQGFLLGQPEFRDVLRGPGQEQFRQRVLASYHLAPLSPEETDTYIRHRLACVGWASDPALADGFCRGVHDFTRGVPRRINTLMDRVLLHAALDEAHRLDGGTLHAVTAELAEEQGAGQRPLPVAPGLVPRRDGPVSDDARRAALARAFAEIDPPAHDGASPQVIPVIGETPATPPRRWPWAVALLLGLLSLSAGAWWLLGIK